MREIFVLADPGRKMFYRLIWDEHEKQVPILDDAVYLAEEFQSKAEAVEFCLKHNLNNVQLITLLTK